MSIRMKLNEQLRRLEKPFESLNEITISKSALLGNFDYLASLIPGGYMIPVLKSNAYGHGIEHVAKILRQRTFPYVAVDGYYESMIIRNISRQPVLIMGAIKPQNFKKMSFSGVAFVVHDTLAVDALGATGRKVKIHVELDTGMTRHGVANKDLEQFIQHISRYPKIEIEGVLSHLADADNPKDESYTVEQVRLFDDAVKMMLDAGVHPKYIHIAQSAGSTKAASRYANTLRVGIALYGINPLEQSDPMHSRLEALSPVAELTSTITKIIPIEKDTSVSYGRTYTAQYKTNIGVLPLGYYEGVPRALSNVGLVKYAKQYLPITGRVCMNHTMIEVGDSSAKVGDKITVYSRVSSDKNSIENICKKHGLFNYELVTGLNHNIRRIIVD